MKTLTKILLVLVASLFVVSAIANDKPVKLRKNEAQVTYSVDINCHNCVKKLEGKLPYVKGVKDFKISLEDHTIWVVYNVKKTDVEKLAKEIKHIGYNAEEVKK